MEIRKSVNHCDIYIGHRHLVRSFINKYQCFSRGVPQGNKRLPKSKSSYMTSTCARHARALQVCSFLRCKLIPHFWSKLVGATHHVHWRPYLQGPESWNLKASSTGQSLDHAGTKFENSSSIDFKALPSKASNHKHYKTQMHHTMYLLRVGSRGTRLRVGTRTTRWSKLTTSLMASLDMKSLESEVLPKAKFATPIMPGMPDASGLHKAPTEAQKIVWE